MAVFAAAMLVILTFGGLATERKQRGSAWESTPSLMESAAFARNELNSRQ